MPNALCLVSDDFIVAKCSIIIQSAALLKAKMFHLIQCGASGEVDEDQRVGSHAGGEGVGSVMMMM